jgi:hypothetical protein
MKPPCLDLISGGGGISLCLILWRGTCPSWLSHITPWRHQVPSMGLWICQLVATPCVTSSLALGGSELSSGFRL